MTIRLIRPFNGIPANTVVSLDRATEAALVSQRAATTDLTGGALYQPNTPYEPIQPVRKKIAVGIMGQSNERGNVPTSDQAAFPQAFASFRKPSVQMPIGPAVTRNGGMWFSFIDNLWDWGYDVSIVNGAIGSLGFIKDACGQVANRANSTGYRDLRLPAGCGDQGYQGEFIVQSSKLFRCSTGRDAYAFYSGPIRPGATTQNQIDYIVTDGAQATAGSDPATWAASVLGGTVTDGTIVWTNVDNTNSVAYAGGQIFSEFQAGFGWDPFGAVDRLHQAMQAVRDVDEKWIILCNGQGDAQGSVGNQPTVLGWYQSALTNLANYYLNRGYKVAIGLSNFPTNGQSYQWDTLESAKNAALAAFASNPNVAVGGDLYAYWGITPPVQPDQVHLTAPGCITAGVVHANAFRAFLPQLTVA
jgi:hypothetical protein